MKNVRKFVKNRFEFKFFYVAFLCISNKFISSCILKKGYNRYVHIMISSKPSQNKRKKAKLDKTKREKQKNKV